VTHQNEESFVFPVHYITQNRLRSEIPYYIVTGHGWCRGNFIVYQTTPPGILKLLVASASTSLVSQHILEVLTSSSCKSLAYSENISQHSIEFVV
jgi:hypothetical protein